MKTKLLAVAALLPLAACGTTQDRQEVEAVRDFVATTELQQVDNIRLFTQLHYTYVNDFYVTVPSRRGDFLVEFRSQCRALRRKDFTPEMVDYRHDPSILRTKFDTIRGCHIDKIYELTEEQRKEIEDLGDAPGDEVFLPDDHMADKEMPDEEEVDEK